ncbi:hypothetical protein [Dyella japonica]|uniref:Uncharacterized protein n=1 Tax=Dyella japonica TaxID=231455 RepID=A0ABV2K1C0_9GAMM
MSGAAVANAGHPRGPEDTDLARADYADLTPQMQAIYTLLLGDPNAQESAHLAHLQQAVRQPWLQNQLMRLVVRHESEWYADDAMSKWTALDPLYNAHPLWAKEKERIKKLLWWKDVTGKAQGFPVLPTVWPGKWPMRQMLDRCVVTQGALYGEEWRARIFRACLIDGHSHHD